jgi:hypothetical protein
MRKNSGRGRADFSEKCGSVHYASGYLDVRTGTDADHEAGPSTNRPNEPKKLLKAKEQPPRRKTSDRMPTRQLRNPRRENPPLGLATL